MKKYLSTLALVGSLTVAFVGAGKVMAALTRIDGSGGGGGIAGPAGADGAPGAPGVSGASSLAVTTGTSVATGNNISSPTTIINFSAPIFTVQLRGGATAFVQIDTATLFNYLLGSTNTWSAQQILDNLIVQDVAGKIGPILLVSTGTQKIFEVDGSSIVVGPGRYVFSPSSFTGNSKLFINLSSTETTGTEAAISGYMSAQILGPGTQANGMQGFIVNIGSNSNPGAEAVGGMGWCYDLPWGQIQCAGLQGFVYGQGVAPQYVGVNGYATWRSDLPTGTTSWIIGVASLGEIFKADRLTNASTGTYVGFLEQGLRSGSSAAPNHSWGYVQISTNPNFFKGNLGVGANFSVEDEVLPTAAFDVLNGSVVIHGSGFGLQVGNSGNLVAKNNVVGIGTLLPSSKLDVNGGSITVRGTNSGLNVTGLANSPCVSVDAAGNFVSVACGSGGGGSSSLATSTGTNLATGNFISSPTSILNFQSPIFMVKLTGASTAYIQVDTGTLFNYLLSSSPTATGIWNFAQSVRFSSAGGNSFYADNSSWTVNVDSVIIQGPNGLIVTSTGASEFKQGSYFNTDQGATNQNAVSIGVPFGQASAAFEVLNGSAVIHGSGFGLQVGNGGNLVVASNRVGILTLTPSSLLDINGGSLTVRGSGAGLEVVGGTVAGNAFNVKSGSITFGNGTTETTLLFYGTQAWAVGQHFGVVGVSGQNIIMGVVGDNAGVAGAPGGGSSSLAVGTGSAVNQVIITSPTAAIIYDSATVSVQLTGAATAFVKIGTNTLAATGQTLRYSSSTGMSMWDTVAPKEMNWSGAQLLANSTGNSPNIAPIVKTTGTKSEVMGASFNDALEQCRGGNFMVPSYVNQFATPTVTAVWFSSSAGGATGNAIWDFRYSTGITDSNAWDVALTTVTAPASAGYAGYAKQSTISWQPPGTSGFQGKGTTSAMGWTPLSQVDFLVCREGGNASDTLPGDAILKSFMISIPMR